MYIEPYREKYEFCIVFSAKYICTYLCAFVHINTFLSAK